MLKSFAIAAVLAIYLAQHIISIPTASAEDADAVSNNQNDADMLPGRKLLREMALKNYSLILNFQLLRTAQMAKDVFADRAVRHIYTEEMDNDRLALKKYAEEAQTTTEVPVPPNRNNTQTHFFMAVGKEVTLNRFENFIHNHNVSLTPHPSDAQKALWQTLLRHGLAEYKMEVKTRTDTLALNFADEVLRYASTLNADEREKEKDLVAMCEMFGPNNEDEKSKLKFGQIAFITFISEQ